MLSRMRQALHYYNFGMFSEMAFLWSKNGLKFTEIDKMISLGGKLYFPITKTIWKHWLTSRTHFCSFTHKLQRPTFKIFNVHPSKVSVAITALVGVNVFIEKSLFSFCFFSLEIISLPSADYLFHPSWHNIFLRFTSLLMLRWPSNKLALRSALWLNIRLRIVATISG